MNASFHDWACIPAHIMDLTVSKLETFSDYVRFCGVCPQWSYIGLESKTDHKANLDLLRASHKKLPMLMFKTDANDDEHWSLFSVSDRVTYTIKLPSPYKYRFAGSFHGWLFYLEKNMVVTLVNPCNNFRISLPVFKNPKELFRTEWHKRNFDYYFNKGILLSDPTASPNSFGIVVTYGIERKLAFLLSNEPSWNFINPENNFIFWDVILHRGKLYGVDHCGGSFVQIDLHSKTMKTIVSASTDVYFGPIYLVESQDGELLMVKRMWAQWGSDSDYEDQHVVAEILNNEHHNDEDLHAEPEHSDNENQDDDSDCESEFESECADRITVYNIEDDLSKTSEFKVFKITYSIEEGSASWVEIPIIGEQALFLGDNHSVSVSTIEFPDCLPNSIYFTSESYQGIYPYEYCGRNEDSGIFNLEDGSFSSHHVLDSSSMYVHPPIWFVPNPQGTWVI